MKKLIDVPDEYERELKMIAAKANVSVKKWIEEKVILSIKKNKLKNEN